MSNIIKLLERIGQDANLQNNDALEQAIKQAKITTELQTTLLQKDTLALERQLDTCPDIIAFLAPAKDDEPSEEESPDDGSDSNAEIRKAVNN